MTILQGMGPYHVIAGRRHNIKLLVSQIALIDMMNLGMMNQCILKLYILLLKAGLSLPLQESVMLFTDVSQ